MVPDNIAARRARNAVAEFPSDLEDLWKIKMRPEAGNISVMSLSFSSLSISSSFFPAPCS